MTHIHIGMQFKNEHAEIFSTQLLNSQGLAIADFSILQENGIPEIRHVQSLSHEDLENFVNESMKLYKEWNIEP